MRSFLVLSPARALAIKNLCRIIAETLDAGLGSLILVDWLLSMSLIIHLLITAGTEPWSVWPIKIALNIDSQALIIPKPVLLEFKGAVLCSHAGFGKGLSRVTAVLLQFPV